MTELFTNQQPITAALPLADERNVHAIVDRARTAGAEIIMEPAEQPRGFTAVFADPDGHLLQVPSATYEPPLT